MKPNDVKSNTYINFNKENNKKDSKFEHGDLVRILKYKKIIAKGYTQNQFEEVFVIKKAKYIVLQTYDISDLNGEEIVGTFYWKELQKTNNFRVQKVIKRKCNKLYVKWKGYDNSFNSWVGKNDLI